MKSGVANLLTPTPVSERTREDPDSSRDYRRSASGSSRVRSDTGVARWTILLALLLAASGCSNQSEHIGRMAFGTYTRGDYEGTVKLLEPLTKKTDENFVLNNVRLGSAALAAYDLDRAESAFLAAYEVLNSVGVNDGGRTLGAVLVDEKLRIWRGEPFERAMANFYLGVIYYMRGEYDNARAAFENSLFKLRDYGEGEQTEDKYREIESNFALGYLMLAKSWQRLGDDAKAQQNFDRAVALRNYLGGVADPQLNKRSNVLLLVDFGYGARKVTNFDGAIVGFAPTPTDGGPIPPPSVFVDGRRIDVSAFDAPPTDTLALAADRRWQSLDTIRTIKSVIGTGLIGVGAYEAMRSNNRNNQAAGLAMIGAGLLLKATSQADTRQWEMVPRTTFVLPLQLPPGKHDVTVQFPVPGLSQTWQGISAPEKGEATYYIRMQRYQTQPRAAPVVSTVGP